MITTNVTLTRTYQKIASDTEAFIASADMADTVQYAFADVDALPAATLRGHELRNPLVRETTSDLVGFVYARINPMSAQEGAILVLTKAA